MHSAATAIRVTTSKLKKNNNNNHMASPEKLKAKQELTPPPFHPLPKFTFANCPSLSCHPLNLTVIHLPPTNANASSLKRQMRPSKYLK